MQWQLLRQLCQGAGREVSSGTAALRHKRGQQQQQQQSPGQILASLPCLPQAEYVLGKWSGGEEAQQEADKVQVSTCLRLGMAWSSSIPGSVPPCTCLCTSMQAGRLWHLWVLAAWWLPHSPPSSISPAASCTGSPHEHGSPPSCCAD